MSILRLRETTKESEHFKLGKTTKRTEHFKAEEQKSEHFKKGETTKTNEQFKAEEDNKISEYFKAGKKIVSSINQGRQPKQ